MGRACSTYVGEERRIQNLSGESEVKRPLGTLKRRWHDNIKLDLQEVGCAVMDWIELTQDKDRRWALVNAVMNIRVP